MRNRVWFVVVGCLILCAVGCGKGDEVRVFQRNSGALPGFDKKVQVKVGDIKKGEAADITILGTDGKELASKAGAKVGDRISFEHDGKAYELEVTSYYDELVGNDDYGRFRVHPKAAGTK